MSNLTIIILAGDRQHRHTDPGGKLHVGAKKQTDSLLLESHRPDLQRRILNIFPLAFQGGPVVASRCLSSLPFVVLVRIVVIVVVVVAVAVAASSVTEILVGATHHLRQWSWS